MGGRGTSSASGKTTGGMGTGDGGANAPKSKAQAIAEQIDPELTAAFLEVVMSDGNMFTNRTAEKAVQDIIDFAAPASHFEKNISESKKEISRAKRSLSSKKTTQQTKDRARRSLKVAQESMTIDRFNMEVARLLGFN